MLIKRTFQITVGILALLLSIIGFLVPLVPGSAFLLFGVILISPERGKRITEWLKSKFRKKD